MYPTSGATIRGDLNTFVEEAQGADKFFIGEITKAQKGWRKGVIGAVEMGIASPCFSTALSFYDGYRAENSPANLIQAQRDYFGAHTYQRLDKPGKFHTQWPKASDR